LESDIEFSKTHIVIIVVVYEILPPLNEVKDESRDKERSKGDIGKHG